LAFRSAHLRNEELVSLIKIKVEAQTQDEKLKKGSLRFELSASVNKGHKVNSISLTKTTYVGILCTKIYYRTRIWL
jgi:hypothetical protein